MIIRAVKQEEYSFIEDFVYEIFKNTSFCKDGLKNISGEVDYTIYHSLTH